MRRWLEIAYDWRPDFAIVIVGLMTLTMGVWLITPAATFSSSTSYSVLATTAPEWAWGLIMVLIGGMKVYGTFRRNWRLTKIGCWGGFLIWMFFAFSFLQANPNNPITAILFWKAILDGWFVLHVGEAEASVI